MSKFHSFGCKPLCFYVLVKFSCNYVPLFEMKQLNSVENEGPVQLRFVPPLRFHWLVFSVGWRFSGLSLVSRKRHSAENKIKKKESSARGGGWGTRARAWLCWVVCVFFFSPLVAVSSCSELKSCCVSRAHLCNGIKGFPSAPCLSRLINAERWSLRSSSWRSTPWSSLTPEILTVNSAGTSWLTVPFFPLN